MSSGLMLLNRLLLVSFGFVVLLSQLSVLLVLLVQHHLSMFLVLLELSLDLVHLGLEL